MEIEMENEIVLNGVVYVRKNCKCSIEFPSCGDRFGVRNNRGDRSYLDSVFECIASDIHKIVAKKIKGYVYGTENNYVFDRSDWQIQKLSDCVINSIA